MRLIGVVHLPALPGSPRSSMPLAACIEAGVRDARALAEGGADGIIIENFNDMPFRGERVDAHTVAAMTAAALAIREAVDCDLGINVLRNDAAAALGIAMAVDAAFVRVNVHTGAMLTDQGLLQGRADETLRLRRSIGAESVRIFADVLVKHAVPLGPIALGDAIRDAVERGLADAIVITGTATGVEATRHEVEQAVEISTVPVYVGSGVTAANVGQFVPPAVGVIVGTSLKRGGVVSEDVDLDRVRQLRIAIDRTTGVFGTRHA
jgi:membrane complex biogenesis BtpA family protein